MNAYNTIGLFDTSIATHNVGDEIIMKGVGKAIETVFPHSRIIAVPSHEKIYKTSLSIIRNSTYSVVGGSNILSSSMNGYKQWKIDLLDSLLISGKVVLLGVGWRAYQGGTNTYSKYLLRKLLNQTVLHSVRDAYTEKKLREIGISNVINTGCPTMWGLTEAHCLQVPTKKSDKVVFTLTDYSKDLERDGVLIESLQKNYNEVYFWIQGKRDLEYLKEFGSKVSGVKIIAPNLKSYDDFLETHECDYVGTRLHGGIRALQHKRRTIIIGIDNRAAEKKEDFNLPVVARATIEDVSSMITSSFHTRVKLPLEKINQWKSQFVYEGY